MSNETPWEIFHRLWTKAVGTPGYDKREWKRLEKFILGYDTKPL